MLDYPSCTAGEAKLGTAPARSGVDMTGRSPLCQSANVQDIYITYEAFPRHSTVKYSHLETFPVSITQ